MKRKRLNYECEQLINLVRSIFDDNTPTCDEKLLAENANKILALAEQHNILPLVYNQLAKIVDKSVIDQEYKNKSIHTYLNQLTKTKAFMNIYQILEDNNIKPIVVKGIVCRDLYGKLGSYRPSSDEDIYITMDEYELTRDVLTTNGFVCLDNVEGKLLSEEQEISFYNKKSNLLLEVHLNLIGKHDSFHKKLNERFEKEMRYIIFPLSSESMYQVYTLDYTDHFIFLILHAYKHLGQNGFGIRQLLDICLFEKKFATEIDYEFVNLELEKCGALDFWMDLRYIGYCEFGLGVTEILPSKNSDLLLYDMMMNGVFGTSTQSQRSAIPLVTLIAEKRMFISVIFRTLFPKKDLMGEWIDTDRKYFGLLGAYINRWKNFLKHTKDNKNLVKESVEVARRRTVLLKKYGIFS